MTDQQITDMAAVAKRIDRVADLIRLECKQRGNLEGIKCRADEISSLSYHLLPRKVAKT